MSFAEVKEKVAGRSEGARLDFEPASGADRSPFQVNRENRDFRRQ